LLESVKIKDGSVYNIDYHNLRLNQSRKIIFGSKNLINLKDFININPNLKGIYKCRIFCSNEIEKVEISSYVMRSISLVKIVRDDEIDYSYKLADKSNLERLLDKKDRADEILIVKNGFVTDSSFSNVIFFDGTKYFTPSTPLLKGTKRQKYLDEKKIFEDGIKLEDIKKFKFIQFINAMIDIEDNLKIPIENIIDR
ncbi:MAG TPA: aminotransferase class IV, partial [Spirochaetota bacterium]|nr:aminotransferase class IV [Spirochaetota bacterium]